MTKWVKGRVFKQGKKSVMYIYRNGKKGTKKLVSAKHKLSRGHTYVTLAKLGYAIGRSKR